MADQSEQEFNDWLAGGGQQPAQPQDEFSSWLNDTGEKKDFSQNPEELPQGATARLPMSRQLMPEGFQGQGDAYYGDPNGQVGGLGIGENINRDLKNWATQKNAEFNAKVYVRQADGSYTQEDPNGFQKASRLVAAEISGLGDVFNAGAKAVKGVLGVSRGIEDLADMANSPLPDIFKQDTGVNLFLQPALNVYNGLRIATGNQHLSTDESLKVIDSNLQASEIAYSTVTDPLLRNEYIRRYINGENPDFLTKELENPWHELVGELVLDPLNVIDAVMSKAGKLAEIAKAEQRFATILPEIGKIAEVAPEFEHGVVAGLRTMDNARAAEVIPDVAKVVAETSTKVAEGLKTSESYGNKLTRPFFTSTARQEYLADTMSTVFQPLVAAYGNDPDSAAETIKAMMLIGSGDAKKAEQALDILKSVPSDLSNVILSQGGMETSNILHKMQPANLEEFTKALMGADETKKAAAIEEFVGKMEQAGRELYPSVSQHVERLNATIKAGGEAAIAAKKELDAIPSGVLAINSLHENLQKVYKPINAFFGDVYIVSQPGTQLRNMLGNMTHAFVDLGPQSAADILGNTITGVGRAFGGDVAEDLPADVLTKKMLGGSLPRGASTSLGGSTESGSLIPQWVRNAAGQTERAGSSAVVYNSVKHTMQSALKEGVVTPKAAELIQAGLSPKAADRYISLMQTEFFGDHEQAWAKIQKEFSDGFVETWRNPRQWMNPADVKNFEQSGIMTKLEDISNNAASLDEATVKSDAIVQKQLEQAAGVFDEVPAQHIDDMGDNLDLAGGDVVPTDKQTEFTLKRIAAGNARNEFYNFAHNILNDPQASPALRTELKDWMSKGGSTVSGKADGIIRTADNAAKLATTDPQAAWAMLQKTEFGKHLGPLPDSLRGGDLRDFIWNQWGKPTRSKLWTDFMTNTRQKTVEFATQAYQALGKDPKTLFETPEYLKAEQAFQYSRKVESASYVSGKGLVFDSVGHALNADQNSVGAITQLAKRYGISTASEAGVPAEQHLLNIINAGGEQQYKKLADVPFEAAQAALQRRAQEAGQAIEGLTDAAGERLPIPRYFAEETMPTSARVAAEGLAGTQQGVARYKQQLQKVWGQGETVQRLAPEVEAAMSKIGTRTMQRVTEARVVASAVANATRDFTLLGYGKKNYFDVAMAYIMPYGFYQAHTMTHWMKRLATNPAIAASYFKYRKAMASAHANLPDFWKYNINSDEVLGVKTDSPFFLNLEATLNPMNALTGTDYTDPDRIVGEKGSGLRYWTQTLDGLGKFGPSIWTPITMLTAYGLHAMGQKEAAQAWGGRLIPQTATVKAISSLADGAPLELDPAIQLFGDGKEKNERNRIGRAAAAMIQEGTNQAQMLRQLDEEKGPLYEQAYQRAVKERAPYQLLSYIGGTGMKARTQADVQVDQFYDAYRSLWAQRDGLSPDEFNTAMTDMQEQYPFMDSVLLAKKSGMDRDRGYAYNVMSRIPPGSNKQVGELVDLDPRLLDKFYQDKGDTRNWSDADTKIFYAKIAELGAVLDIPETAVRQEWTLAKNEYSRMGQDAKGLFGENIDDLVNGFYSEDPDFKQQYLTQHPQVQQYMDWRAEHITNDPLLSTYYNGLGQIENYWRGHFRKDAEDQFGVNIYDTVSQYYDMKNTGLKKDYESFFRAHPEIKKYEALKEVWDIKINRIVVDFGKRLPEGIPPQVQTPDPTRPQSFGEQDLRTGLQQPQGPQWNDIAPTIAQDLKDEIANYFDTGKQLTYSTKTRLDRTAKNLGMTLDDLLQMAGMAMDYAP